MIGFLRKRKIKKLENENKKYETYLSDMIRPYYVQDTDSPLGYIGLGNYLRKSIIVNEIEISRLKEQEK